MMKPLDVQNDSQTTVASEGLGIDTREIDAEIKRMVEYRGGNGQLLYDVMRYHMGWKDDDLKTVMAYGGKRIRSTLCLTVSEALSGGYRAALPVAAAIELVHNSSLLVDDVYDQSLLRRGRKAAWVIWGPRRAILAGLSMQALMNIAALRLEERRVSPVRIMRVLHKLSDTLLEMCEGQFMDISFEEAKTVSVDSYLTMVSLKTASLIECATCCGALLSTDDQDLIACYGRLGRRLGIVFQIVDDILGVYGKPDTTGKPQGIDLEHKKKTLPLLYGLAVAGPVQRESIERIYGQETVTGADCARLVEILMGLEADKYCRQVARQYLKEAEEELHQMGIANAAQDRLVAITRFIESRIY